MNKKILVLGAGGFIGHHLSKRLKDNGFWVRGVDLKLPEYEDTPCDDFKLFDLRDQKLVTELFELDYYHEVYQLAADMGGAGYIFTGDNDTDVMHNSASINLNVLNNCKNKKINKIFYSSSACIYPAHNQLDPDNPDCREDSAYPANPDSEYGWEKLFSERLYLSYQRNYNINVRIGRFHNIYGPLGTWKGGREKAPAAICRKVASAKDDDEIEIWGPGTQTRSFLYIDECVDGILKLTSSDFTGPVNIGSEEMISINDLVQLTSKIANKNIKIKNIDGPVGVMGRNSNNDLALEKINWEPSMSLKDGIKKTYDWIVDQIQKK